MSQSKKGSLIEALVNIAIGYSINIVAQMVILPMFDLHTTLADNLGIGAMFTGISLVRTYVIRRWFNKKQGD